MINKSSYNSWFCPHVYIFYTFCFLEDGTIEKVPKRKMLPNSNPVGGNDTTEETDCAKQLPISTENPIAGIACDSTDVQNQQKSPSLLKDNEAVNESPSKQRLILKRLPYSRSEQQQIVDYIIDTKSFQYIKGNQLWQEMERDQTVCKGRRTWQSMKENFHKQIVPQLHKYKNVNNKAANCFKRVLMGLTIDLDSDSNEEKENSPKKRTTIKDKYAIESDTTESDSEETIPKKKIFKEQLKRNHKFSRSPGVKTSLLIEKDDHKARRKRRSLPIMEGDTSEDELDNLSRQSLPRNIDQSIMTGNISICNARSINDVEENHQGT